MAPFYGWGSTASRLEPLRGGSLLFTTVNCTNGTKSRKASHMVQCLFHFGTIPYEIVGIP